MAKKQTFDEWYAEDAARLNEMSTAVQDKIEVHATQPELNPDGSLKDETQAAEDADVRRVANEYGIDEEVLRNEYRRSQD